MDDKTPRIVLIGAGDFGQHYLRILRALEKRGEVSIGGVVVNTTVSTQSLQSTYPKLSVSSNLDIGQLKSADGVIIATPPETHAALIKQCAEHCPVLVEKPVVQSVGELSDVDTQHEVMVAQTFRFHPVMEALRDGITKRFSHLQVRGVTGTYLCPADADKGRDVLLELNHWIDALFYLFDDEITAVDAKAINPRLYDLSLHLEKHGIAQFKLGWDGEVKDRTLTVHFDQSDVILVADFCAESLSIKYHDGRSESVKVVKREPLERIVTDFLAMINNAAPNPIPLAEGLRSVAVCDKARRQIPTAEGKSRVAVIGAGIFGVNTAFELADFCNVTLYERKQDVLREGTRINQFRHHIGYHYPRSDETVEDIKRSTGSFEERYGDALFREVPTYYGIAKEDSHVDFDTFTAFCDRHGLSYEHTKDLHNDYIESERVQGVVQVPEATYQHEKLTEITRSLLAHDSITLELGTVVADCKVLPDGRKELMIKDATTGAILSREIFDYVVNCTYAHMNTFARQIGARPHPVRVDLAEVLIVELPIDPISLTIMDGPFCTLMTTGNKNEFTLYHAQESILDRYTPADGLVRTPGSIVSNSQKIMERAREFFPILEHATVKESRIVHRGVLAFHEHDDARVADIVTHGFGCWSILSGKIVSAVQTAKNTADLVRRHASESR